MNLLVADLILYTSLAYLLSGLIFAIVFHLKWIEKIDESAHGTSIPFRLIITPGVVVLWPLLWKKIRHQGNRKP